MISYMISYIKYDIIVRLMQAVEEGDIEIIDMWEESDGDQDVTFAKQKLEKTFTNQDEEWQKQRQLRLYHRSIDYVIAKKLALQGRALNSLCWQDGFVCTVHPLFHQHGLIGACCHSSHLHQGLPHQRVAASDLGIFWDQPKGSTLFRTLMSYVRLLRRLALSSSIWTRVSRTAA